jgi:hypothetical protein
LEIFSKAFSLLVMLAVGAGDEGDEFAEAR